MALVRFVKKGEIETELMETVSFSYRKEPIDYGWTGDGTLRTIYGYIGQFSIVAAKKKRKKIKEILTEISNIKDISLMEVLSHNKSIRFEIVNIKMTTEKRRRRVIFCLAFSAKRIEVQDGAVHVDRTLIKEPEVYDENDSDTGRKIRM